jgi:hypothetical protein
MNTRVRNSGSRLGTSPERRLGNATGCADAAVGKNTRRTFPSVCQASVRQSHAADRPVSAPSFGNILPLRRYPYDHGCARIALPMMIPILATLSLLIGLGYWNDWLNGLYYINSDKLFSIQVLLNRMLLNSLFTLNGSAGRLNMAAGSVTPTTGIKMAVAVLGALPVLIVYPLFQQYFVKGITIDAVKG